MPPSPPLTPYRALFDHVLARLDAERAHRLGALALRAALPARAVRERAAARLAAPDPVLRVRTLGMELASPLGVAAGLDKDATVFRQLGALGFGFVEIGTVTARPQPGNPRPRVWRVPGERALVNRMGFPNAGATRIAARLRAGRGEVVVGANVGKSKAAPADAAGADYAAATAAVAPWCDYLVVNVSSPNTPGLRDMQAVERLAPLVADVRGALERAGARVPLLVKIAPDLADGDIDAIADLALELALDGLIAVNTTVDPDWLARHAPAGAAGGVSGAPLAPRALAVLRRLRARVGDRLVLVSVGGVSSAADVLARIEAGATLVQAYSGFVYGGPAWPARVNRELARLVRARGVASVQELVGTRAD